MRGDVTQRPGSSKPMQVGGQAVIEGVMMRAPGMVATAVRRSDGSIEIKKEPFRSVSERHSSLRIPVLRGAVALIEMMVLGIRTLNFSAERALQDVLDDPDHDVETPPRNTVSRRRQNVQLTLTVVVAFLIGTAVFFAVPLFIATSIPGIQQLPLVFNLIAGTIRVSILLAYLALIARSKDVRRLFQYHGAEHKAVYAFERGLPLTVLSSATQSRFHPRCGTSLLLVVMVASIMLFAILDAMIIAVAGQVTIVMRLSTHLPLIPLVGGFSYEFLKLSARNTQSKMGRFLVAPGLWLQRITTREPDDDQLEVALAALRSALGEDVGMHADTLRAAALPVSVN